MLYRERTADGWADNDETESQKLRLPA